MKTAFRIAGLTLILAVALSSAARATGLCYYICTRPFFWVYSYGAPSLYYCCYPTPITCPDGSPGYPSYYCDSATGQCSSCH